MYKTVQQLMLMQYKLAVPSACVQMNQQQMYKKCVCIFYVFQYSVHCMYSSILSTRAPTLEKGLL